MGEFVSTYVVFSVLIVLIIIVVGGGVFLLLRPLVLWYFKLYSLESELRTNNALLRKILEELKNKKVQTPHEVPATPEPPQPEGDYSRYMPGK